MIPKFDYLVETACLSVSNPVLKDPRQPLTEAAIADLRLPEVRAVYPMIKAIHSGRPTQNWTYYPAEALMGKADRTNPTGYYSLVWPHGKPILTEHRLSDRGSLFSNTEADVPMGRVFWSGFRRRGKDEIQTPHKKAYMPGTVEGNGYLLAVPAITDEMAIQRVLGYIYQTVSIGAKVGKLTDSITGLDLIDLHKKGKELPTYEKGQVYTIEGEEKLCFHTPGLISVQEISYVNAPSDNLAGNAKADIGEEGVRLLLGEKKVGSNEFCFFDAVTSERVDFGSIEDFAVDETFNLVDSAKLAQNVWVMRNKAIEVVHNVLKESVEEVGYRINDIVQFELDGNVIDGKVVGIYQKGTIPNVSNGEVAASENDPGLRIRIMEQVDNTWKYTNKFVGCSTSTLKPNENRILNLVMESVQKLETETHQPEPAPEVPKVPNSVRDIINGVLNG